VVSANPTQTYRITILNSPNVNAFALPGGYLYVTRGLLALANDSSELAAVIAHEMGHVTANHGLQRQQLEAEEGLATKVVSDVLGDSPTAKAALIRGKLRLAQFSRNQELQADAIGIKSIGEAGYDPYAAGRFLQSMSAYTDFRSVSGATDASLDFLATHPNTPQRIELAQRLARNFGPPGVGTRDRDAFLAGIDGLLYGDTPEEGYVRGQTFLHGGLGIRFDVPPDFRIDNKVEAVMATGPGDIAIRFDGVADTQNQNLTNYISSGWVTGLDPSSIQSITVNGMPAATARASADRWDFDVTVIRDRTQIFRFLTAVPKGNLAQLDQTANVLRSSFRHMTPEEASSLKPLRVRVVTVKPGDTITTLAARMMGTDRKLDLFKLINALPTGANIAPGDKVKIIAE
jgi:predicted Zn-dependent protease